MIRWSPGPKERGCIYHQRGVYRLGGASIVADVFVMPRIASRRPIAITIGRYRDYRPISKAEWQLTNSSEARSAANKLVSMFEQVGTPPGVAATLGRDVQELLVREAPALTKALASVDDGAGPAESITDDDIPF